jgi:hypothetical protein
LRRVNMAGRDREASDGRVGSKGWALVGTRRTRGQRTLAVTSSLEGRAFCEPVVDAVEQ